MKTAVTLGNDVGKKAACEALDVPRSTFYRTMTPTETQEKKERAAPPLALSHAEQQRVLDVLHLERFWDRTPYQVYATLLDEGTYLCSARTM